MTHTENVARPNTAGKTDLLILAALSTGLLFYLMLTSALSSYGYFIDEFYYIACSKRLAFGYVDHPPFSIVMLAMTRWILGESMLALRFLPALAIAGTVFITGMMARRLGGTRVAMVTAAIATIAVPVYLVMGSFYSMNALEILTWTSILYIIIKLVQEDNPKYWLAIGLLMGIGLETKHTMVLCAIALLLGILLTTTRRLLWNRWFVWGVLSCFLLLLPNLIWQYVHGFPSLEFYRNAMISKNIPKGPLSVVRDQILFINPLAAPLWITGVIYCLFSRERKQYQFLGGAYLILLMAMILGQSSRPDRIAAMYTVFFASGAVAIERLRQPLVRRLVSVLTIVVLIGGGIALAPISSPLLPPPTLKDYISAVRLPLDIEKGKTGEQLPQWLADRLGWRELASDVAQVYHSLPSDEQRNSILISTSYGEAGALELYGPEFGLPPVFCTHNSFHFWGPPPESIKTYIAVFVRRRDLESKFESVVEARLHTCADCTRPQQRIPIYVARGPRFSVTAEWPKFKIYD
jgi:hypothetical protein